MVTAQDISREIGNVGDLKRKSKVRAFEELPGVPEGTTGRVALVDGWDRWVRYHVLFDNGVSIGSVNRDLLVPAKRYEEYRARRTQALESGVFDEPDVDEAAEVAEAGGEQSGAGASVNGVEVPAHLLERSKQARERLGAA
jgi:hypothetical protein